METNLTRLFQIYQEQNDRGIIELQNIDRKPVGALYLDKMNVNQMLISETNNAEKYMLIVDGIAIYFSYYRKF